MPGTKQRDAKYTHMKLLLRLLVQYSSAFILFQRIRLRFTSSTVVLLLLPPPEGVVAEVAALGHIVEIFIILIVTGTVILVGGFFVPKFVDHVGRSRIERAETETVDAGITVLSHCCEDRD